MKERSTWKSTTTQVKTASCIHCGQEIQVDDNSTMSSEIPTGISVIVGVGGNITADETGYPFLDYRVPEVVIKWFSGEEESVDTNLQHMCPPCAESVYNYDKS